MATLDGAPDPATLLACLAERQQTAIRYLAKTLFAKNRPDGRPGEVRIACRTSTPTGTSRARLFGASGPIGPLPAAI